MLRIFILVAAFLRVASTESNPCDCSEDVCILVPPAGSSIPCYQGNNNYTTFCYENDVVVRNHTPMCNTKCSYNGYEDYLRNDPVYKNMELWV